MLVTRHVRFHEDIPATDGESTAITTRPFPLAIHDDLDTDDDDVEGELPDVNAPHAFPDATPDPDQALLEGGWAYDGIQDDAGHTGVNTPTEHPTTTPIEQEPSELEVAESEPVDESNIGHGKIDLAGRSLRHTSRIDYSKNGTTHARDAGVYQAEAADVFLADLAVDHVTPTTYAEAMASPDRDKWIEAMQSEINDHQARNTITPTVVPVGTKVIKTKFIFKIKEHADGTIDKYKARLVAQGFKQSPADYDYTETFSPTLRYELLRLVVAVCTYHRSPDTPWVLHAADAVTAYLNAQAKGTTYVTVPELWEQQSKVSVPNGKRLAGLVNRALNGLVPSGRDWYDELDNTLIEFKWRRLTKTWCIYIRDIHGYTEIIASYVDDFIIACGSSDPDAPKRIIEELGAKYDFKYLGPVTQHLGIQVSQTNEHTYLHLEKYIMDASRRFGIEQTAVTPIATEDEATRNDDSTPLNKKGASLYRSITGTLMFASNTARPDIAYAVQRLTRAMSNPTEYDMIAAKRVLSYLSGTARFGIRFSSASFIKEHGLHHLQAYSDANWAGCIKTRKSTSGYAAYAAGGLICWSAALQPIVAQSSCESEFIALAELSKVILYLQAVMSEILDRPKICYQVYADNQGAIDLSKNDVFHRRSKHIDVRYFFIRECVNKGAFKLDYVRTEENVADGFTKPLTKAKFKEFVKHFLIKCNSDK